MSDYPALYGHWQNAPESYWAECAQLIDWDSAPSRIFDAEQGPYGAWFPDATLNTAYNCLDRHVLAGHGARTAFIWDSAMEGRVEHISYAQAQSRVAHIAGALANLGIRKGDRVVIYMPMVPEAAFSMLACARLGAIHSMVFGGFAPPELAARISDAAPKLIIAASCGLEPGRVIAYKPMLDAALKLATHQPDACLIFQRPACEAAMTPGLDHDFREAEAAAAPHAPVMVEATDPLYILYTSGTTGPAQRRGARQWRPCRRPRPEHENRLRRRPRRGDVYRRRYRLGGRPFLCCLCPAPGGRDLHHLRGQTRRHARCRGVLARDRPAQGENPVHRAHGLARHQAAGFRGQATQNPRPLGDAGALPRGRTLRPADRDMDRSPAEQTRHR
jgi:hypothetical protein